jgi:hypothetical protein
MSTFLGSLSTETGGCRGKCGVKTFLKIPEREGVALCKAPAGLFFPAQACGNAFGPRLYT